MTTPPRRRGVELLVLGSLFLLATAATFASLGVALPVLRSELGWSWAQLGAGFSALALGCGATAYAPSVLIGRAGPRWTARAAGGVLAFGLALVASAESLWMFYAGCACAGLGFSLAAPVLGEFVLVRRYPRPASALGFYYGLGAIGGVVGPWAMRSLMGSSGWRMAYAMAAVACLACGLCAGAVVDRVEASRAVEPGSKAPLLQLVRRRSFQTLWAALFVVLAAESTVSTFAVPALLAQGRPDSAGTLFLSVSALATLAARLGAGPLIGTIGDGRLLACALGAVLVGTLGLAFLGWTPAYLLFAILVGGGFGLSLVSSTTLLLGYFGLERNLELFGALNTAGALAALGPLAAGALADASGGLSLGLAVHAGLAVLAMTAVLRLARP